MTNVLDLRPRLEARRNWQGARTENHRLIVSIAALGEANCELLASGAVLVMASLAEISAYWLRVTAIAEQLSGAALSVGSVQSFDA